ncbi:DedA family protein [soil metagenome]
MEILKQLVNLFLHLDKHLGNIIQQFGGFTYVILFAIIFAETGLVILPFLPGDSLLFVAGTLAGSGHLSIVITYISLLAAAILGDTVNYWIGHYVGPSVFTKENSRIFKKEYLEKTREFFDKYGGKTIILARFFPIIRTFAPFVAGVGKMHYQTFLLYNLIGGFLWVTLFTYAGFFFGGLEFVQHNFHYAVVAIILISLIPLIIEFINYKRGPHLTKNQLKHANYKDLEHTLEKEHLND